MKKINLNRQGFTLIELLLAMALFSFVMLALSSSILQLYKIYQSTVGVRNTQQAARLAAEEITRRSRETGLVEVVKGTPQPQTNTDVGAINTDRDVLCFYNSSARESGVMFYTRETAENRYQLWRHQMAKGEVCALPVNDAQADRIATDQDVSFVRFEGTLATDPNTGKSDLITVRMTVAAATAVQAVDLTRSTLDPGTVTCSTTVRPEWCSITNLSTSVELREVER